MSCLNQTSSQAFQNMLSDVIITSRKCLEYLYLFLLVNCDFQSSCGPMILSQK